MTTIVEPAHHYAYVNGIRFHYVRAGTGKRLVLLLHGFPEFWYSWRKQIGPLSERFTVVAPDLRGYNLTDKPNWGYSIDVLVQDVVGLIRELGFESAIVVGHDWGGNIAWNTAIAFPHRVERLIALNIPHPSRFAEEVRTNRAQQRRSWYILAFQLPWLPEAAIRANLPRFVEQAFRGWAIDKSAFSDEDLAAYVAALSQPGALTAMINYYRAIVQQGSRGLLKGTGGKVTMPTLMIWGEDDEALGKELTYGTERFVPNLTIHYIPHCSHWVQQEQPDEVNRLIGEFLADL